MAGNEIDGRVVSQISSRAPALFRRLVRIQIRRSDHSLRRLRRHPDIALQIRPERVPVLSVPLCPSAPGRKTSHLVHAARIPGLRDQLHARQQRIPCQTVQKRRVFHRGAVLIAPKDAGQVESESIDMIVDRPVPQALHDQLLDNRMIAVDGVPAAGKIVVIPIRRQHIVDVVVEPLERYERPIFISLRSMVENHIQNDLDARRMEIADQRPQLVPLVVILLLRAIARIGGKIADSVISPVIDQFLSIKVPAVLHLVKLEDRHHLHCRDPEPLQIRNFLPESLKCAWRRHAGTLSHRETAHMELINHQILHRNRLVIIIPVIGGPDDPRTVFRHIVLLPPDPLPCHGLRIDVEQLVPPVKQQSLLRIPWAIYRVGVLKL